MAIQFIQRSRRSFSPAGADGKPVDAQYLDVVDDATGAVIATFGKDQFGNKAFSGLGGLRVAHAIYDFAADGGAVATIAPRNSDTIPDNAIMVGGTINVTTAVLSGGSATVAIGTSAGSSATSIKAATAKASLSADAVLNAVPVFATPVKMTAAGTITFTVAVSALTAGVIEVWIFYVLASA